MLSSCFSSLWYLSILDIKLFNHAFEVHKIVANVRRVHVIAFCSIHWVWSSVYSSLLLWLSLALWSIVSSFHPSHLRAYCLPSTFNSSSILHHDHRRTSLPARHLKMRSDIHCHESHPDYPKANVPSSQTHGVLQPHCYQNGIFAVFHSFSLNVLPLIIRSVFSSSEVDESKCSCFLRRVHGDQFAKLPKTHQAKQNGKNSPSVL